MHYKLEIFVAQYKFLYSYNCEAMNSDLMIFSLNIIKRSMHGIIMRKTKDFTVSTIHHMLIKIIVSSCSKSCNFSNRHNYLHDKIKTKYKNMEYFYCDITKVMLCS